jgi:hypothetical protein
LGTETANVHAAVPNVPNEKEQPCKNSDGAGPAEGDLVKVQVSRCLALAVRDQGEPGVLKNSSTGDRPMLACAIVPGKEPLTVTVLTGERSGRVHFLRMRMSRA